jgi:hypothetical protein
LMLEIMEGGGGVDIDIGGGFDWKTQILL